MTSFKIIALLLGAISAAGYKGEKRQAGGISASFSDEERCYGDPDCFFELTVNNVTYPVCWETYTTDAAAYNLANFLRAACADVGKLGDEEPAIFGILPEYGEYSHYWSVLPCSVEYGDNLQDYQDCVSLVSEATCGNNTPAMFFAVLFTLNRRSSAA
nr:hypothetical protein BaRGS_022293 [Batillaria attramentaria]